MHSKNVHILIDLLVDLIYVISLRIEISRHTYLSYENHTIKKGFDDSDLEMKKRLFLCCNYTIKSIHNSQIIYFQTLATKGEYFFLLLSRSSFLTVVKNKGVVLLFAFVLHGTC
jgi:hypothetical protein